MLLIVPQDELAAELEELEQEELEEQLLDVGPAATGELPEVPTEEPVKQSEYIHRSDLYM